MIVKTRAIPLRIFPFSETSRVVIWLTDKYGKLSTLIKGSQRPKSLFLGQYDSFYTCELLFYFRTYQGLHIVKECAPLKTRNSFRTQWKATACASYFTSVAFQLAPPQIHQPEVFHWLESALDFFSEQTELERCFFWFELKLLEIMGLAPQLDVCLKCKRPLLNTHYGLKDKRVSHRHPLPASYARTKRKLQMAHAVEGNSALYHYHFSFSRGGIYCNQCDTEASTDNIEMPLDILGMLRFWQHSKTWHSASRSRCSKDQLKLINQILESLLVYHLGINKINRQIALELLQMDIPKSISA